MSLEDDYVEQLLEEEREGMDEDGWDEDCDPWEGEDDE